MTATLGRLADVRSAVAAVCDPEFPGVTLEELGMLHTVRAETAGIVVELIPTFLGCPALEVIASDVAAAAASVCREVDVRVVFTADPVWSADRISPEGRRKLATDFTVAVPTRSVVTCPVCGSAHVEERSMFGPTMCRAIGYCPDCLNPVEILKT